jgi:polyvinyl alcohol dehydrogenase (cytochrome)
MISGIIKLGLCSPVLFAAILLSNGQAGKQNANKNNIVKSDIDSIAIKAMGKTIFAKSCAACHGNPAFPKAPSLSALSGMEPRVILNALNNGKMKQQASSLSAQQREAVAQFAANKMLKITIMPPEAYTAFTFPANSTNLSIYSGWGGNLAGTGFRTTAQAGITPANVNSLQLKWAFAFPDESDVRSKPAVIGNWVIVGSQSGDVYALNKQTGKIGWHVTATAAIRSGIIVVKNNNSVTAYFTDMATYTYAVNVKSGKVLWSMKAGQDALSMNTGTPAVYGGKVFVPISSIEVAMAADSGYNCCTTSGGLAALDTKTGAMLWYHRVVAKATALDKKKNGKPFYGPSGAPVWCSPTVDVKRGLVYIGTGENYSQPATNTSDALQAISIKTGKLVWNFQATSNDAWNLACPTIINCPEHAGRDLDFGMAPILVKGGDGKERLVAGQKSGVVYALEPQSGKLLWKTRVGKGGALGGVHWGMAADGQNVYAANADNKLALNPDDSTRKPTPGIYALDLIKGNVVWTAPSPEVKGLKYFFLGANSAAPTVVPGIVFAGSLDGHIRGYDTKDGHVIWDYDTIQKYQTTNGVDGKGGSIDGPAPVIIDGMLFVNSGYSQFGERAGNVLLAFELKK